ncbi:tyrosine-type recombinase/integrase [Nonomuraea dietziae]|uniref:tyrosine-type recombinase/integrase n=1 Tax=Nonomuraea dietziae TaxID=65515 RepID=UPI00342B8417
MARLPAAERRELLTGAVAARAGSRHLGHRQPVTRRGRRLPPPPAPTPARALRTAALLGLMLTGGLRVAEVCGADIADLGHHRGYRTLTVRRKGGKNRAYPLAPPITQVVDDYLDGRAARDGTPRERLAGAVRHRAVPPARGGRLPRPRRRTDLVTASGRGQYHRADHVADFRHPYGQPFPGRVPGPGTRLRW